MGCIFFFFLETIWDVFVFLLLPLTNVVKVSFVGQKFYNL